MNATYIIENGKEHIIADNYYSENFKPLTIFLDFFDMIRNTDREYATYEVLTDLQDRTIDLEEAYEYVPILRFFDDFPPELLPKLASDLIDIHNTGKETLESALLEQRTNEESFFKTLLIRMINNKKDHEFLCRFNFRKFDIPISNFGDWISFSLNYLNDKVVCCGRCEKCGTYYPIYRGGSSLYKNRYCPVCRNNVRAIISEKEARNNPILASYRTFYQRYYAQFKRYYTISHEQFKNYIRIAGKIRDCYLAQGKDDAEAYQMEVENEIAKWKS